MNCVQCRDPEHEAKDCRDFGLDTPGCFCKHIKGTTKIIGPDGKTYIAPPGVSGLDVMR